MTIRRSLRLLCTLFAFSLFSVSAFCRTEVANLSWCCSLGGSGDDRAEVLVKGSADTLFIVGWTESKDFSFQRGGTENFRGEKDVFISKIHFDGSPGGSVTIGGTGEDRATCAALDKSGNLYIAGWTWSDDFPSGNLSPKVEGTGCESFVCKFDPNLRLTWTCFSRGMDWDQAEAIALDEEGNVIIAGYTYAAGFPAVNAYDSQPDGITDGFLIKLNPNGEVLWSTFLGGTDEDSVKGVIVGPDGSIYATGSTASGDFPGKKKAINSHNGKTDSFIVKFLPEGELIWATFVGGKQNDSPEGLAIDAFNNLYLYGKTSSSDFPLLNGFQESLNNPFDSEEVSLDKFFDLTTDMAPFTDGYITEFSSEGELLWSSFLGGALDDEVLALAIDSQDHILLTGRTESTEFPAGPGWFLKRTAAHPGGDCFISRVSAEKGLIWSSYLGGTDSDAGTAIVAGGTSSCFFAGWTESEDFSFSQSPDSTNQSADAFVAKIVFDSTSSDSTRTFPNKEYEKTGTSDFVAHTVSRSQIRPFSVAASDIDADGDEDIIASSIGDRTVMLYRNSGDRLTEFRAHRLFQTAEPVISICSADVDRDGESDLLCCCYSQCIEWWENKGTESLSFNTHVVSDKHYGSEFAVADFDSDGDVDILATEQSGLLFFTRYRTVLYVNNGKSPAGFDPCKIAETEEPECYCAADLDGDADPDIAIYQVGNKTLCILENRSSKKGILFESHDVFQPPDGIGAITACDLDGDGDNDLLCGPRFFGEFMWLENSSSVASLEFKKHTISSNSDFSTISPTADIDGDGDLDLVTSSASENTLSWWENSGGSVPTFKLHDITTSAEGVTSTCTSDLDSDGDIDIVAAHSGEDKIVWYENKRIE